ncbi:MAG TPA: hypothetical protein VN279_05655, partial [Rhodocyclaceae bacterium]|nr:hypothetical protein [Rhodocyclaceae bacterium]
FLSLPLHPRVVEMQPRVVQVWYEPDSPRTVTASTVLTKPQSILTVHGALKIDLQAITWSLTDTAEQLVKVLSLGGRVIVRVHCGHLVDRKERPFSSALDAVVGFPTPHVPAGVWESWFFVAVPRIEPVLRPRGRRAPT